MNSRPNALTGKRPDDLIADERRGSLQEHYPIATWSEHRVRTDCHVQVRSNFYSVPYEHVGKRVVVRLDANTITVYADFEVIARHERQVGRGRTVTDRQHYPEHKRKATQEIRRERRSHPFRRQRRCCLLCRAPGSTGACPQRRILRADGARRENRSSRSRIEPAPERRTSITSR